MEKLKVKIKNASDLELPKYANLSDVGMDIRANIKSPIILLPFKRVYIPTGLYIELPKGYQAEIRSRSGMGLKYGVSVLGGVGTIDPMYKGEIGVVLINQGQESFKINPSDRIAQIVFSKFESVELIEVEDLGGEDRGGGFGSTGK